MFEHAHESGAFAGLERRQDQALRCGDGRIDIGEQAASCRGDMQRFGATVGGAASSRDQALFFQPAHDIADGRAVERDGVAQRGLVDARIVVDGIKRGILHRREVERLGLVEEQGEGDLLQPADEMTRHISEAALSSAIGLRSLTGAADCLYTDE